MRDVTFCVIIYLYFSAGVFCAIVSHPADSVVSKLNQKPGSSPIGILKELGWKGALINVFCYNKHVQL